MTGLELHRGRVHTLSPLSVLLETDASATPMRVDFTAAGDPAALLAALAVGTRVSLLGRRLPGGDLELTLFGRH